MSPSDIRAAVIRLLPSVGFAMMPAAAEAGGTLDRVLAAKTLVLAVDEEYPPFASRRYDGQIKGFDIDVARELAARLGVALKIVLPGWKHILDVFFGIFWVYYFLLSDF